MAFSMKRRKPSGVEIKISQYEPKETDTEGMEEAAKGFGKMAGEYAKNKMKKKMKKKKMGHEKPSGYRKKWGSQAYDNMSGKSGYDIVTKDAGVY